MVLPYAPAPVMVEGGGSASSPGAPGTAVGGGCSAPLAWLHSSPTDGILSGSMGDSIEAQRRACGAVVTGRWCSNCLTDQDSAVAPKAVRQAGAELDLASQVAALPPAPRRPSDDRVRDAGQAVSHSANSAAAAIVDSSQLPSVATAPSSPGAAAPSLPSLNPTLLLRGKSQPTTPPRPRLSRNRSQPSGVHPVRLRPPVLPPRRWERRLMISPAPPSQRQTQQMFALRENRQSPVSLVRSRPGSRWERSLLRAWQRFCRGSVSWASRSPESTATAS